VTDAARLDAILARLGDLETSSAAAHAGIAGAIDRLGDRVDVLAERQAVANGRTGKLESTVAELQVRARMADKDDARGAKARDFWMERAAGLASGVFLLVAGAVIGYIL
jgi:hypothetical protein